MIEGVRTRAVLDEYATVLLVAALAVAAVGGVVAYDAHASTDERQVERTVEEFRVDGSFAHRATVREGANTTTFEPGATVHNRSVYFSRVMPTLRGRLSLRYAGADAPATVHVSRRLVVESVSSERETEDRTVYWRDVRSLGSNATTLVPGDRTTVPFAVNVSRTLAEARNESARLGAPGSVQTRVVFDVTVDRESANGTETLSFVLPVTTEGSVYRVDDDPRSVAFNHTATTTVADPPSAARAVGGPLALVLGLFGALTVHVLRRSGALAVDGAELEYLAYHEDRADYADWITDGRLPAAALERPSVVVDSLAGLADVAIDAGERVVHDRDRDEYAVVHGDLLYVYEPPVDAYGETDDALARTNPSDAAAPTAEAADAEDLPFGDADAHDPDAVLDQTDDGRDLLDDPASFDDPGDDAGTVANAVDARPSDDADASEATGSRSDDDPTPNLDVQD